MRCPEQENVRVIPVFLKFIIIERPIKPMDDEMISSANEREKALSLSEEKGLEPLRFQWRTVASRKGVR
jgi:hypothetical protein